MASSDVCVDVAGAASGGAARFRGEFTDYLHRHPAVRPNVIGSGRSLSPQWLLRREMLAGSANRVATNNTSFIGRGRKIVLLRNPLHFLRAAELARLGNVVDRMALQIRIARAACRRADVLVTPTAGMAERVIEHVPSVAGRIEVRAHPLSSPTVGRVPDGVPDEPFILYPSLIAVHKDAAGHTRRLDDALGHLGRDEAIVVTCTEAELPSDLRGRSRIRPVGAIAAGDMPDWYAAARMVYFPATIESFGYPLAEARVAGRPVVAANTVQNSQVAGPAMCGFAVRSDDETSSSTDDSLEDALSRAADLELEPDPGPFDPDAYFDWLLAVAAGR